jgi:hypothetical protein
MAQNENPRKGRGAVVRSNQRSVHEEKLGGGDGALTIGLHGSTF